MYATPLPPSFLHFGNQLADRLMADAVHLVDARPLHRLPLVAHQRHTNTHHLPSRDCRPGRCLRSVALGVAPLRDVREQEAGRPTQ